MNHKFLIFWLQFLFCSFSMFGQDPEQAKAKSEDEVLDSLIRNEETIYLFEESLYTIDLKDGDNSNYYGRLKQKLIHPYNQARESALIYKEISDSISQISKKSAKKKFIKDTKKELDEEFRKSFVNMSRWQGEIYIKLIHRNTNKTVAEIIKENRGTMALMVFQAKAGMFNLDLDSKFDPVKSREDKFLEVAIAELVAKGKLKLILPGDKANYKIGQKTKQTKVKKKK